MLPIFMGALCTIYAAFSALQAAAAEFLKVAHEAHHLQGREAHTQNAKYR